MYCRYHHRRRYRRRRYRRRRNRRTLHLWTVEEATKELFAVGASAGGFKIALMSAFFNA